MSRRWSGSGWGQRHLPSGVRQGGLGGGPAAVLLQGAAQPLPETLSRPESGLVPGGRALGRPAIVGRHSSGGGEAPRVTVGRALGAGPGPVEPWREVGCRRGAGGVQATHSDAVPWVLRGTHPGLVSIR